MNGLRLSLDGILPVFMGLLLMSISEHLIVCRLPFQPLGWPLRRFPGHRTLPSDSPVESRRPEVRETGFQSFWGRVFTGYFTSLDFRCIYPGPGNISGGSAVIRRNRGRRHGLSGSNSADRNAKCPESCAQSCAWSAELATHCSVQSSPPKYGGTSPLNKPALSVPVGAAASVNLGPDRGTFF